MDLVERRFRAMGTEIRVLLGRPPEGAPGPREATAIAVEAQIVSFGQRLSRFRADSELSRFNQDPRGVVPASALLRTAVHAGLWAAELTGGLVDPTLVRQIEAAGYAESRDGVRPAPLPEALAAAPPRRPARPDPRATWRSIEVLDDQEAIRRPVGVMFDTGGTGKGLAGDLVARRLGGYSRYAIDCGGDVRVGGADPGGEPIEIEVRHPLTGAAASTLRLASGAVATSGLDVRIWRLPDGRPAHHLLDPASGEPAWTGLIGATALGRTGVEAEALAKAALLSGPDGARRFLAAQGGMVFDEAGRAERIGSWRNTD